MGSIVKVTWGDLAAMSVPVLVGAVPIPLVRWQLNTLAFGEDAAASLGVNVRLLRGVLVFCATLLTACVVAMAFPAGEACCILGPNGVGKTTLFRTLLGRLRPLAGRVLVAGRPASSVSARDFARKVAYVPQASEADTDLTVLDVVLACPAARVGALGPPGRTEYERAQAALAELGIERLAERPFSEVSGGERQMALVARALVQDALLVLMDEPTASLDFGNQARVLACVRRLVAEGRGVVMTSHNPDHAFLCCSRAVLLRPEGRLEDGSVDEVVRADALAETYGVGVRIGRLDMGDGTFVRACVPKV